jgi:hypothetical protein
MICNFLYFFISYAVAFIALGLIGKWYLWPAIRRTDSKTALSPLLLYACLRVNGLMFLMPGLVAPSLPGRFAVPTAWGDVLAAVLALAALAALRSNMRIALFLVWVFNIEGVLDLAYANLATFTAHVDPAQLGTSYYLAVLNVPAMIVVHIIIFAYLMGPARSSEWAPR